MARLFIGQKSTALVFVAMLLFPQLSLADTQTPNALVVKPVKVKKLQAEQRIIPIHGSGRVAHDEIQALSFKVSGYIKSIAIDEGDQVIKGQLLAVLDQREVSAQLRRAKAAVDKTRNDFNRLKELKRRNLISDELLDGAQHALTSATSAWDIAANNARHSKIYAPADGVVVSRPMDSGEFASIGKTVIEVAPAENGWVVRFGLADREVARLRLGERAMVYIDAWDDIKIPAHIVKIDSRASRRSGTFEIEVKLDLVALSGTQQNSHAHSENQRQTLSGRLRDGYFARVELLPESPARYYFLPLHSLLNADGKAAAVMVIDNDNIAHRRTVMIKHLLASEVAVSGTFHQQERLVLEGAQWLAEGDRVLVANDFKLAIR